MIGGGPVIARVRLRNWKSHLESDFEFSKGVNAIIGIMGSGKTSIMQAISFGLFGTFPALQARRVGLDELIMKKPQAMDDAEVGLEFSAGGKAYSVVRAIRRGKGTARAELRQDGRLLEATPQGVSREVARILDMDYEMFSRAVYSEQNAIDYFLRIPRGQRMEHIDRMLRLDRFERAREGAVSLANRIRHGREEKLRLLAELRRERLPERISGVRKELEGLQEEAEGMGARHEKSRKRVADIEDRVSVFERGEAELNEVRKSLEGVESGIRQIEESVRERSGHLEGLGAEPLARKAESARRDVEGLESEIRAARAGMEHDRERVASLNTELKIITESVEDIQRLGDRCPLCESDITPAKKRELLELRRLKEEKLRKEIATLASGIEKSGQSLSGLESGLEERRGELDRLSGAMKDAEFIKGLEKRKGEYEKRKLRLAAREGKLSGRLRGVDIKGLREELKEAVGREGELRTKIEATEQRIADRQEMLKDLRSREELMVKYSQESMLDQELVERMGRFVDAVRLTQDQLREEFLKSVNSTMELIWGELYPYGDFTGIRLAIEKDYVLQLRENGDWINVEGLASGGERSMAALALRVAFSMAFVPNLRWLILDEPTHNLDDNAIEHLTDALRERIGSFVEQVFLITHDERVSEGVGGNLYRLERDKDRNEPTRIAGLGETP
jgi:exonuclease SbcC